MIKGIFVSLLATASIILMSSCSFHARNSIRSSGPFVAEQKASFLPQGWSGFLSDYYPGVLAIVGDSLFFDTPGRGSKPIMKKISYFSIPLKDIVAIDAGQNAISDSKIVTIYAPKGAYWFLMKQPQAFCEILKPLTRAE
ncbi:MAG: hypothetical protein JXA71_03870 [Chitinispirillaceae bacterium]|nr:hypothetical protein [Chitinispirillaceae bacterium]